MSYQHRNEILARMGFPDYQSYLASDLWAGIRKRVLEGNGRLCCACHGKANQVHHSVYDERNLSGASLSFMHAICDPCHRKIEFDGRGKIMDMKAVNNRLQILMSGSVLPEEQFQDWRRPKKPRNREEKHKAIKARAFKPSKKERKRLKNKRKAERRAAKLNAEFLARIPVPLPSPEITKYEKRLALLEKEVADSLESYRKSAARGGHGILSCRNRLNRARVALEDYTGSPLPPIEEAPVKPYDGGHGITRIQAEMLGLKWPLKKGWRKKWAALAGINIPDPDNPTTAGFTALIQSHL